MGVKITGADEVINNLEKFQRKAEALNEQKQVTSAELFPDSFVSANTTYPTLLAMIDASGLKATDLEGAEWNAFVVAHSHYPSWQEMRVAAGRQWMARKLGF